MRDIDYGIERFESGKRQTAILREVATLLELHAAPDGSIRKGEAVATIRGYQSLTRTHDERAILHQAAGVIGGNPGLVLPVAFVADVLRRTAHMIADLCGTEGPVPTLYLGNGKGGA